MKYIIIIFIGVMLVLLNSCAPNNKLSTSKETSNNISVNSSSAVPAVVQSTSAGTNLNTIDAMKQSVATSKGVTVSRNATANQITTTTTNLSDSANLTTTLGNNYLYGFNNVDINVSKAKKFNQGDV